MGLAEVADQRNDLDNSLRDVTEGITLCRQFSYTPPLATDPPLASGLVTLAWIRQASGDPGGALAAIAEAMQAAPGLPGLLNPVPARRAGCCWPRATWPEPPAGRKRPASARTTSRTTPGNRGTWRWRASCRARPGPALALLDRLHATAAAQARVGSPIEIGALRALALAASGEEAAAVAALAGALTLACPQGHVRVFADEGPPMAALLARLIAAQRSGGTAAEIPPGCLARLQRALGAQDIAPEAGRGRVTAVPGLVEQLTSRELEVLEMLAAGRPNHAIASQLVITPDTVKKHVSHILGKLGAANRTEAVTRARELSLIP